MRVIPDPSVLTHTGFIPGATGAIINGSLHHHAVDFTAAPDNESHYDSAPDWVKENPMLANYLDALSLGRDKISRLPDYIFADKFKNLDVLQKESVSFIMTGQDTLLADEQGTGKTITALAAAYIGKFEHTLIICPQIVKGNWATEISKWLPNRSTYTYAPNQYHHFQHRFTIVNYDLLDKFLIAASGIKYDMVIVDECHYLKRNTSKRTQNVLNRLAKARCRLFMSGTPLDRPYDMWPILSNMRVNRQQSGHDFAVDEMEFIKTYCGGYKSSEKRVKKDGSTYNTPPTWVTNGSSNEKDLHDRLVKHVMIRHRAPKWSAQEMAHSFERISLDDYVTPRAPGDDEYSVLLRQLTNNELTLTSLASKYINDLVKETVNVRSFDYDYGRHATTLYAVASGKFGRGVVPPFEEISAYRKLLGEAKIPAAKAFITNFFISNPGRKLVVFTAHKAVAKTLAACPEFSAFNPVTLTGDDSAQTKTANVNEFQTNASCRLIVCNISAANMGVTLTAACDILHVEMEWSGFKLAQANARIDRRGQTKACRAFYLVVANSLDLHMAKVVHKKSRSASLVLGDIENENLTGKKVDEGDESALQALSEQLEEEDKADVNATWAISERSQ